MTVVQLASQEDVEAAFGRDLTTDEAARVDAILDKASELFRIASGQQFTPGESTNRLIVQGGQVTLAQRPVVGVELVIDDNGYALSFTRFDQILFIPGCSTRFVRVTYTHGDDIVPDSVRLAIAEIGKKVLSVNASAASGVTQHTESTLSASQSDTYATWAIGGQTMLAPDDYALARTFLPVGGSVIVQNAPTTRRPNFLS